MPRAERWRAYLLRCGDGSLYCGASNDVERRLAAHAAGKGARYTRSRGDLVLAWRSAPLGKSLALSLEARIKRLDRADKLVIADGRGRAIIRRLLLGARTSACRGHASRGQTLARFSRSAQRA
jgi:putative endonuclease